MFETVESGRKSDRTRARISAAAIDSFIERGYADTTMRLIAERAGVSVGNAYYYFPSKNHLVQELYERVQHQHADLARPRLQDASTLIDRLRVVFCASLETLEPYRRSAPGFLTAMVTPDSPINPLASESAPARDLTVSLFREAIGGSTHRLPADIADLLPEAMFIAYLALTLRWTYDSSPGQKATSRLLDAGLQVLSLSLPFVRVPGVHGAVRSLLSSVVEVTA